MTAKDTDIHIDKSMLAEILPPQGVFRTVTTGCNKRRPAEMISWSPEQVTCRACRDFAASYWDEIVRSAEAALRLPAIATPAELTVAAAESRWLRDAFRGAVDDPLPGPRPGWDIQCCGNWIPYPGPGETAECPACHSTFRLYEVRQARKRLEYLRGELRAERISYGELAELQGLAGYIESGDTELLEAAGVPEFPDSDEQETGQ